MGLSIEFYAAEPRKLVALFTDTTLDDEQYFARLEGLPMADFSLHLQLPEDLDRLSITLQKHGFEAPSTFREFLQEELWYDGATESLTLLTDTFATLFARLSDDHLAQVATDWAAEFGYQQPIIHTPAYKALYELRDIASHVINHRLSIVTYLLGASGF
ncbi:hypothetical protein KSD_85970 [Ktedonobacter sp. SOSP1-85]|uniref:hypothetical protein n=1 Tax=Ktedonobacter sp. SOSP1-85 TaxID=2778367 RepID=UPI001915413E|nr:hypothetical protein [Ktedonobacter sp. SOSP1-85]GHO80826.1 hypothetical protein KSD_85970 [Ktedonobacter sp. SOSP1-85]